MKKRSIALALALLVTLAAAGCGKAPKYNDGIYFAQADNYDESGWMDAVTIEVDGGKIVGVDYNSYNEAGQDKKTLSEKGEYNMVSGGARSQWHEQTASLEAALKSNQDISKITLKSDGVTDAVSGVTMKANEFVALSQKALEMAK